VRSGHKVSHTPATGLLGIAPLAITVIETERSDFSSSCTVPYGTLFEGEEANFCGLSTG
jgi:hypothetical protein